MSHEKSTVITGTRQSQAHMTRDEVVALFDRRQEACDNLNAGALATDYADDCIIESPTAGTHHGRAAAKVALQALFDAFVDMKVRSDSLVIDGNRVAQVLSVEGTDIGGFMGLPATGKHFHLAMVLVYELKDRQIVRERRIY